MCILSIVKAFSCLLGGVLCRIDPLREAFRQNNWQRKLFSRCILSFRACSGVYFGELLGVLQSIRIIITHQRPDAQLIFSGGWQLHTAADLLCCRSPTTIPDTKHTTWSPAIVTPPPAGSSTPARGNYIQQRIYDWQQQPVECWTRIPNQIFRNSNTATFPCVGVVTIHTCAIICWIPDGWRSLYVFHEIENKILFLFWPPMRMNGTN